MLISFRVYLIWLPLTILSIIYRNFHSKSSSSKKTLSLSKISNKRKKKDYYVLHLHVPCLYGDLTVMYGRTPKCLFIRNHKQVFMVRLVEKQRFFLCLLWCRFDCQQQKRFQIINTCKVNVKQFFSLKTLYQCFALKIISSNNWQLK